MAALPDKLGDNIIPPDFDEVSDGDKEDDSELMQMVLGKVIAKCANIVWTKVVYEDTETDIKELELITFGPPTFQQMP